MLWIPEAEELNLLEVKDKVNFDDIINKKRFTVRDSTLTYRQANSMDEDNMLPTDENRDTGWRKFSLKELIYIELVLALKKLGLKHSQLRGVWESFFKEYKDIKDGEVPYCKLISDEIIAYVMGHIDIVLTVTEGGAISYMHPVFFTMMYPKDEPFVFVSMSNIVNKVMRRIKHDEFIPSCTICSINHFLTKKEEHALDLLRDSKYKSVKLTKKDGEIETIYAETATSETRNDISFVIDAIKNGKYQEVSIIQRDGKIVNISQEETIKV